MVFRRRWWRFSGTPAEAGAIWASPPVRRRADRGWSGRFRGGGLFGRAWWEPTDSPREGGAASRAWQTRRFGPPGRSPGRAVFRCRVSGNGHGLKKGAWISSERAGPRWETEGPLRRYPVRRGKRAVPGRSGQDDDHAAMPTGRSSCRHGFRSPRFGNAREPEAYKMRSGHVPRQARRRSGRKEHRISPAGMRLDTFLVRGYIYTPMLRHFKLSPSDKFPACSNSILAI
jgi:hypothetical protein